MNRRNILIVSFMLVVITSIVGVSFAYFTMNVTGNEEATSVIVSTAKLSLTYTNGQEINAVNVSPGWTATKTFSVQNTGTKTIPFFINFTELNNTFINKNDLVYVLTDGNDNIIVSETVIPSTNTMITQINEIDPNETLNFKFTITYKSTATNQNTDMNKQFMAKIQISGE